MLVRLPADREPTGPATGLTTGGAHDEESAGLRDAALAYVRRGWPVFPLHGIRDGRCTCGDPGCRDAGKHPRERGGFHTARASEGHVIVWWAKYPGSNIGLPTGRTSGLAAIDMDPRNGGDETLRQFEERFAPLPSTVEATTGGGGRHIFFTCPHGGLPSRTLGPGLELKGDGSYVVLAPSMHRSGRRYAWAPGRSPDDIEPAPLPGWIIERVQATGRVAPGPGPKRPAEFWRALVAEGAAEGERNVRLAQLVGHLLRCGVDPWAVLELARAWNEARCHPPLEDSEVVKVVNSIAGRELQRRKEATRRGRR
ncbi:bifunctional DNA primase/polymerase [Caldinitratiruptor microaerophilus]|uniref:DNA primase n=1 Tax=Caldinitratiruptor microaerophilus TaxID=671077 RepID=A0AA35G6L9_9FIRM|nr:bifunctional DNA primase/polymerase [Caldinitratiruptor microaerophilus]BDG61531.1 DNA primase [Caldinitratiruptor microaerophilus]